MATPQEEVTGLLVAWGNGDYNALQQLMPLVYEELRRKAHYHMSGQPDGHTLQTTELIHEAFLKLVKQPEKHWQNRAHFLAVASQAMRHILVDYARSRQCAKRGGELDIVALDEVAAVSMESAGEMLALDSALTRLSALDPRKSRVVEMRYFGGLTVEEIAGVLGVSPQTVMRDWRLARTWLRREIGRAEGNEA